MDIFTHAVTGTCTGAVFGRPFLGALIGILPDFPIWRKARFTNPPALYLATHSHMAALFGCIIGIAIFGVQIGGVFYFSWLSHIALDIPTHNSTWNPRFFWPCKTPTLSGLEEWEWFNRSWWKGLLFAFIWSASCLGLLCIATGFQS